MNNLISVVKELKRERSSLTAQLEGLDHALLVLSGTRNHRTRTTISAAGRARIAAAQRARWAKIKGQKVLSIRARKGPKMSPAARKRIVAAQKARWAKWRKAQKQA